MSGGLITTKGKLIFLNRTYKGTPDYNEVSAFKVGVGTTAAVTTDTDLEDSIPIDSTESIDDCETADWTDSADMTTSLNSTTYKEGSNSLNLKKDGTGSANANTYKTTTSRDFTSKDFGIWIYIKDATAYGKLATSNCLEIRFGSDSSNYYYWQKDKADLAVGWNLIHKLTTANADGTTGSPVVAACDYTFIQLTADASATVWSDGDFMMDDIKLASSGDYTKAFETSYPTLDETALSATIRCRLSSLQGNGYAISEFGLFNADGTPLIESRDVFTGISKGNTDELIFIVKNEIE